MDLTIGTALLCLSGCILCSFTIYEVNAEDDGTVYHSLHDEERYYEPEDAEIQQYAKRRGNPGRPVIPGPMADTEPLWSAFIDGSNQFAMDLFRKLSDDGTRRLMASPLGLQMLTAMLVEGAENDDKLAQLKKAMHFPESVEEIRYGYRSLERLLVGPHLNMAISVFLNERFRNIHDFPWAAINVYSPRMQNFITHEVLSNLMNQWASFHTNNKIPSVEIDSESSDIPMVLANAIHFKSQWKFKFEQSTEKEFNTFNEKKVMVKMMHSTGKFEYADFAELGAQILEIPNKCEKFRVVIILPYDIGGIFKVEKKIRQVGLGRVLKLLKPKTLEVFMPRFKLKTTLDLTDVTDQFSCACKPDESPDEPILIEKAEQKVFIEVDESGTEFTTVDMFKYRYSDLPSTDTQQFIVNRPFLVMVTTLEENLTLFVGRIDSPDEDN